MELKDLTTEEIERKIEELKNQCVPLYNAMKPLEQELIRREQIEYVGKFFRHHANGGDCVIFTHIKSATLGEYGLRDVKVDKIRQYETGFEAFIGMEEYNYRYLGTEIGEQEWNAAVLRAKDFLEGM